MRNETTVSNVIPVQFNTMKLYISVVGIVPALTAHSTPSLNTPNRFYVLRFPQETSQNFYPSPLPASGAMFKIVLVKRGEILVGLSACILILSVQYYI